MSRIAVASLPASLRGMLEELASADAAASQKWILTLLQRHGPDIVAVLWRMLGREQDVCDAYQSVVCQLAARTNKGIRGDRGAYFYRAAMNAAIELMRRRKRERDRLAMVARRAHRPESPDVSANLDHLGMVDRVRQAVMDLPPHLRDVVVLHDLAGHDYRSVSRILGITDGTARVYRRQAVIRLSVMLAKEES